MRRTVTLVWPSLVPHHHPSWTAAGGRSLLSDVSPHGSSLEVNAAAASASTPLRLSPAACLPDAPASSPSTLLSHHHRFAAAAAVAGITHASTWRCSGTTSLGALMRIHASPHQGAPQTPGTPSHSAAAGGRMIMMLMASAAATGLGVMAASAEEKNKASSSSSSSSSPSGSTPPPPLTNHPLEFDPVTNEHTAQMTLARAAALEYYEAGKYRLAEAKFLEALAEARLGFEKDDPHIASCQNNLAEFYRNTGQHAKAEELYLQALDHLDLLYGEKHWLYASTLHNLALLYESAPGGLKKALEAMEKVVKLRLQLFGPDSFLYADSMFALARILLRASEEEVEVGSPAAPPSSSSPLKKAPAASPDAAASSAAAARKAMVKRAVKLMEDSVVILEGAESVQVSVVLFWLQELAALLRRLNRPQEAAGYLRKALGHMEADKGEVMAKASALSDLLVDCLLECAAAATPFSSSSSAPPRKAKTSSPAPASPSQSPPPASPHPLEEAREVLVGCLGARQKLFGRQLVVAQTMLKLAKVEQQMGSKGDALQNASNAASLSRELLAEYTAAGSTDRGGGGTGGKGAAMEVGGQVGTNGSPSSSSSPSFSSSSSWWGNVKGLFLGGGGGAAGGVQAEATTRLGIKRVQAGHILGSALKMIATITATTTTLGTLGEGTTTMKEEEAGGPRGKEGGTSGERAEAALVEASAVLKEAFHQARHQVKILEAGEQQGRRRAMQSAAQGGGGGGGGADPPSSSSSAATSTSYNIAAHQEELISLLLETSLQHIECLELLSDLLAQRGDLEGSRRVAREAERVAQELMTSKGGD